MNKIKNLRIVRNCGDLFQLEFGTEFGAYAKHINRPLMEVFCEYFNIEPWAYENGFFLTAKYNKSNGDNIIVLKNIAKQLHVQVHFLDHSIFIDACETDWTKIDKRLFVTLQKLWRRFLASNVEEYSDHLRKTTILAQLDNVYSI